MAASTAYALNLYSARATDILPNDPSSQLVISLNYRYQLHLPTHDGVSILLDDVAVPEVRWGFKFLTGTLCSAASTNEFVNWALKSVVGPGDGSAEDVAALEEIGKRIVWVSMEAARKHGISDLAVVATVGATRTEVVAEEEVMAFVAGQQKKSEQQQQKKPAATIDLTD